MCQMTGMNNDPKEVATNIYDKNCNFRVYFHLKVLYSDRSRQKTHSISYNDNVMYFFG